MCTPVTSEHQWAFLVPGCHLQLSFFLLEYSLSWWGIWEKHNFKNTNHKKVNFYKSFGEEWEGSHLTHNKADVLEILFKYFFRNVPLLMAFALSISHLSLKNLPNFSQSFSMTHLQPDKASQVVLCKIKPGYMLSLKNGPGAPHRSIPQHACTHTPHNHTHIHASLQFLHW